MKLLGIENSWVDTGYIVGLTLAFGIFLHWSHFIITVFVLILTYLMIRKDRRDAKCTKDVSEEKE